MPLRLLHLLPPYRRRCHTRVYYYSSSLQSSSLIQFQKCPPIAPRMCAETNGATAAERFARSVGGDLASTPNDSPAACLRADAAARVEYDGGRRRRELCVLGSGRDLTAPATVACLPERCSGPSSPPRTTLTMTMTMNGCASWTGSSFADQSFLDMP